jgi:hypothetical protein
MIDKVALGSFLVPLLGACGKKVGDKIGDEITTAYDVLKSFVECSTKVGYHNIYNFGNKLLSKISQDKITSALTDDDIATFTLEVIEKAKVQCNDDIQEMYAKILAGEMENKGSYSKRTLNFLSTMSMSELKKFEEEIAPFIELNSGLCLTYILKDKFPHDFELLNNRFLEVPFMKVRTFECIELNFNHTKIALDREISIGSGESGESTEFCINEITELAKICKPHEFTDNERGKLEEFIKNIKN